MVNQVDVKIRVPSHARSLWFLLALNHHDGGNGVALFNHVQAKAHDVTSLIENGLATLTSGNVSPQFVVNIHPDVDLGLWSTDFSWIIQYVGKEVTFIYDEVKKLDQEKDKVQIAALVRAVENGVLSPGIFTGQPDYS